MARTTLIHLFVGEVGRTLVILILGFGGVVTTANHILAQDFGQTIDRWQNWSNWNSSLGPSNNNDGANNISTVQGSSGWTFGARGLNTRTGVMLREIGANTPASQAGLRVGDTIITVNGSQVGLVGGRLFELEEEVLKRADRNGVVNLVIFSRNTSRLESIDVQMTPSRSELTGVITGLDPYRMPSDSIVTVQIINLSRPHFGVRNGSVTLRPTSSINGTPFSIAYDPAYIDPQDEYAVRAQVSSAGNMIYHSDRNVRVLAQGLPDANVQVRMVSANTNWQNPGAGQPPQSTLTNIEVINRQIQMLYQRYLRRDPYFIERAALTMDPRIEDRLRTLPLDLMATQEFYDAVGNNDAAWISRIFQELAGRRPQPNELQNWQRRFADLRFSRATLLTQLQSQVPR
jgi:uncharacterized lipoprotein YbaY